ncbi:MAG: hypothetical protein IPK87_06220 [Planctomycetes bacterium]|nr:hypothetical protein [Planctomycetota bacterium]
MSQVEGIDVEPEKRTWKRFIPAVAGIGIVAVLLFLLLYPVHTAGARDAVRSDAEQQLGSMKNQARVGYAKTNRAPQRLTGPFESGGCAVAPDQLVGKYYRVEDIVLRVDDKRGALRAIPNDPERPVITLTFSWEGGDGTYDPKAR